MIKIAVFENVLADVKEGLELANDYYFENKLEFKYFTSSQDLGNIENISQFDIAFVDIALSSNSDLDGVFLIEQALSKTELKVPEFVIITGQIKIKDVLIERGLGKIPVIQKPIITKEIKERLDEAIRNIQNTSNG